MQKITPPISEAKLNFLEQKAQALTIQNSFLEEENARLQDELQGLKKINENLKEKLASIETSDLKRGYSRCSSPSLKLTAENQSEFAKAINETNLSQANSQILAEESNETTGDGSSGIKESPTTPQNCSSPLIMDTKQEELEDTSNAEKILEGIKSNPDEFYEINHLLKFQSYSPFSKTKVQQVEKQIDMKEGLLKKWSKSIKEINGACGEYAKALDLFGNQLLHDKSSFEKNKEAQYIIELIAQFFKENAAYLEVLSKIINNSIFAPLRNFYKEVIPSYKESKKKVQKAFEDMEIMETKYFNLKKAAMLKNQSEGQNTLKSYIHTFKNFELARLHYFKHLNGINSKFNTELVDRMCAIFTTNLAYANSFYEIFERSENEIKVYSKISEIKTRNCEVLTQEFQEAQTKIENNDLINYTYPSIKNVVKEGYLFVKSETSGFKKRYCYIQENGMLCWAKESDQAQEQPKIKQVADIKFCRVKVASDNIFSSCFELMSAFLKKPITFQAGSDGIMMSWMSAIEKHIETLLFESSSTASQKNIKSTQKQDPIKTKIEDPAITEAKQTLVNKIIQSNNCADCGSSHPSWLSLNLGVIICLECSGFHRKLGPNISKVRSFKLDNMSLSILELFSHLTTEEVNKVWEFDKELAAHQKPSSESDQTHRGIFIKQKYVEKKFFNQDIQADDFSFICSAAKDKDLIRVLTGLASTKIDLNKAYLIEKRKQGILHFACAHSTKDIVELLLLNGCNLNILDQDGCKPLDHSMFGNNIEVMEYLLNKLEEK